jgi:hypothetical protein
LCDIKNLFIEELSEIPQIRIETPDNKILVVEDFDERFTYLLGSEHDIADLIETLNLEGFYCDDLTVSNWSYETLNDNLKINWEESVEMSKTIS